MSKKSVPMDAAFIDTNEEVFIADKELADYLRKNKFQFVISDSPYKYYVKDKSKQVRVDYEGKGEITLLDPYGHVIYQKRSIRLGVLDKFIEEGAI